MSKKKYNPVVAKRARLKYKYGISVEQLVAKEAAQDNLCRICEAAPATDVDHCHDTGQVRHLLCGNCNRGIGIFKEDIELMQRAIKYLQFWKGEPE